MCSLPPFSLHVIVCDLCKTTRKLWARASLKTRPQLDIAYIVNRCVFYCLLYLSDSGEVFDYLVAHGRMKEKEARAKFRQVWKVVSNFVLLMFLVIYNGQYHKLDFRVCGILKRKIPAFLHFLRMGN